MLPENINIFWQNTSYLRLNILMHLGDNMIDFITYPYSKGYGLHLSDGNNWWITGYDDSIKFVDKLADIMGLKQCELDGSSKLIFFREGKDLIIPDNNVKFKQSSTAPNTEWKSLSYSFAHILYHTDLNIVLCGFNEKSPLKMSEYMAMWYSLRSVYQRSIQKGGLPFHAGLAECAGKGVLFAGQGGTGKSTCYHRLPSHWKPLCDDESLVVLDKNKVYRVHPFPTWSDYLTERVENTWNVQYSVPLSAIFFLEQSEIDEAIPLPLEQAPIFITRASTQVFSKTWPHQNRDELTIAMKIIFNNAFEMTKTIPTFRLRASLNGRFWEDIEKVLPF